MEEGFIRTPGSQQSVLVPSTKLHMAVVSNRSDRQTLATYLPVLIFTGGNEPKMLIVSREDLVEFYHANDQSKVIKRLFMT
jgi:hypothetical protein